MQKNKIKRIAAVFTAALGAAPMAEAVMPDPAEAQTIQQTQGDHQPNIFRSPDGRVYQESHGRIVQTFPKETVLHIKNLMAGIV